MGNLYRFVEPVVLFLLQKKGRSYGYELAAELREHALTDASIEAAALYKTLRQLEQNGCVSSEWDVSGKGPAKRVYCLTPRGEEHLVEWITVLDHVARSMTRFVRAAGKQSCECAGINRHVVGDERALRERSSDSIPTSSLAWCVARRTAKRR
jgi:DNA-binding PadR family transcriptional regulator